MRELGDERLDVRVEAILPVCICCANTMVASAFLGVYMNLVYIHTGGISDPWFRTVFLIEGWAWL